MLHWEIHTHIYGGEQQRSTDRDTVTLGELLREEGDPIKVLEGRHAPIKTYTKLLKLKADSSSLSSSPAPPPHPIMSAEKPAWSPDAHDPWLLHPSSLVSLTS